MVGKALPTRTSVAAVAAALPRAEQRARVNAQRGSECSWTGKLQLAEHCPRQAHPLTVVPRAAEDRARSVENNQLLLVEQDRKIRTDRCCLRREEGKARAQ